MAILKNINESDTDYSVLSERNNYITDPLKTKGNLIGALGCCPDNFAQISRALKRASHQGQSKMIRHFVVAISPDDEGKLSNEELLKAARDISSSFKDCYVKYAVHTDTAHTHFHILVCNTRISDGKQISMSESDLKRFKEHCSSVLREYNLRPVEKLDKSDELLEINEDLFPKALTQEERVDILYDGVIEPQYNKPYYRSAPVQNCGNITTVNVILPPGTQGTVFPGRNGQLCCSFKPSPNYLQLPLGNIPQNNAVYGGNAIVGYPTFEQPSYSLDWYDQDPEWVRNVLPGNSKVNGYGFIREDIDDYDSCSNYNDCDDDDSYYSDEDNDSLDEWEDYDDEYQEIMPPPYDNKPLESVVSSDVQEEKFDPFVIIERKKEEKFDPFIFVK